MSDSVYAVIGCGKQGTAEGFDLAQYGSARTVIMADRDITRAREAADRINALTGTDTARAVSVDASDETALTALLMENGVRTCCGAAHYALNLAMTRAAIAAGANFCDMGGNTGVVHHQHKLHDAAVRKGVSVVPDCGIAPGTANVLAARAIRTIDCDSIRMFCGGLPQNRALPLGYRAVFSISGLTNEYTGMCIEIRNGKIVEVPAFTEKEAIELPDPVGRCEAFLTSGGTSTGPW
ncbi:MAG TPA: saccharopine dehydrogenase NADP-binding domain-containing protein, partial [bacterium]|nr:saccharopine dehydrogenase NADP-binding domain-containing protein [bacterium]